MRGTFIIRELIAFRNYTPRNHRPHFTTTLHDYVKTKKYANDYPAFPIEGSTIFVLCKTHIVTMAATEEDVCHSIVLPHYDI